MKRVLLSTLAGILAVSSSAAAANPASISWMRYIPGITADVASVVKVAPDGSIWVAGSTQSQFDHIGPNDPYQADVKGGADIFLAQYKLRRDGGADLLFWTRLGGTADEEVNVMELDELGRVYLAGTTTSGDFPAAGFTMQTSSGGNIDSWVAIFDPREAGQLSLVFSSYVGGAENDWVEAMYVTPDREIFLAGTTRSQNLPGTEGNLQGSNRGGYDGFFMRINPSLQSPRVYASYLGGGSTDSLNGIVVRNNILWLTGSSSSDDFPVTEGAAQTTRTGFADLFLATVDLSKPGLDALTYGTFWGGGSSEFPKAMKADAAGNLWITGYTFSSDLPITATAAQREIGWSNIDAFVLRVDTSRPIRESFTYATYLGGSGAEVPFGITPLPGGMVAIAGYVFNGGLPTTPGALQRFPASASAEGFLGIIDPATAGSAGVADLTYFGGTRGDAINGIDSDAAGALYIAGDSQSPDLRVTDGSLRANPPGRPSGFVGKLIR